MCSGPPADFKWPEKVGPPSSIVIKDPKDWCDEGILVPHEAIRWWNKSVMEVMDNYDPIAKPDTEWKTGVLFNFLEKYYIPCIHHHHWAEEEIYNPGIEAKGGKVTSKIKDDHAKLMKMLDETAAFRAKVQSKAGLTEFKTHMKTLFDDMEEHLADEERNYPKTLRECMTKEDEMALVDKIIQGLGLDGNKKFLPTIIYAMSMWKGSEKSLEWISAAAPPPIVMMFKQCWISDFNENQLKVLNALKKDAFFAPEAPSCNLCTIM